MISLEETEEAEGNGDIVPFPQKWDITMAADHACTAAAASHVP